MTSTATFSCQVGTTDPTASLGMEIWLDNKKIFDQDHVNENVKISHEFSDDEAEHELRFVMKNKTQEHTQIDESEQIIKDACLTVSDVAFDEIDLGHMFVKQTVYTHSFNGGSPLTEQEFFGTMGCNGQVAMRFTTPIYMWLLENM